MTARKPREVLYPILTFSDGETWEEVNPGMTIRLFREAEFAEVMNVKRLDSLPAAEVYVINWNGDELSLLKAQRRKGRD